MSGGVRQRTSFLWLLLLAGPLIWFAHFMAVYLVVEAACAVDELDRDLLGLPLLSTLTLAATSLAALVLLWPTVLAYRHWRDDAGDDWIDVTDRNPGLAFAGFLLGLLFIAAIGFVGVPAAFLEPC